MLRQYRQIHLTYVRGNSAQRRLPLCSGAEYRRWLRSWSVISEGEFGDFGGRRLFYDGRVRQGDGILGWQ